MRLIARTLAERAVRLGCLVVLAAAGLAEIAGLMEHVLAGVCMVCCALSLALVTRPPSVRISVRRRR